MSCLMLCVTPPASIQPRKTYNVLVPVLFLDVAGDVDEPVPPAVQRKVLKLEEYMQRNPEKIPKARRHAKLHLGVP